MISRNRLLLLLLLLLLCFLQSKLLYSTNASRISSDRTTAFQNLIPKFEIAKPPQRKTSSSDLENDLLDAIKSSNRLGDMNQNSSSERLITNLITQLEETPSIPQPAISTSIYGRWKLVHTTNTNTASPIQRSAVDATKFDIYQNILITPNEEEEEEDQLIVSQVVKFNPTSELRVDALASTSAYPLPELTDRKGTGKVLGMNVLGVSLVGEDAKADPSRPDSRIDFVFDSGEFDLLGGLLKVPYPVPFRLPLLRDTVKGWIDVTYLSEGLRISRGNKGTTFVLVKEEEEEEE